MRDQSRRAGAYTPWPFLLPLFTHLPRRGWGLDTCSFSPQALSAKTRSVTSSAITNVPYVHEVVQRIPQMQYLFVGFLIEVRGTSEANFGGHHFPDVG